MIYNNIIIMEKWIYYLWYNYLKRFVSREILDESKPNYGEVKKPPSETYGIIVIWILYMY